MVTELPAGGGDKGSLVGSSVGVAPGVLVLSVGEIDGDAVPLLAIVGVIDLEGVWLAPGVEVAAPGYASGVFVISVPGYGDSVYVISGPGYASEDTGIGLGFSPGPGYGGTSVSVPVGVGEFRLSV